MITLWPDVLRKSTMLRVFKAGAHEGWERAIAEIEKVHAMFPACPTHGKLADPVIVAAGPTGTEQIGIVCPWCSGGEVLEIWEREGNLS